MESMKLHPRHFTVAKAETDILRCVAGIGYQYNLTVAEMIRILAGAITDKAIYLVRQERSTGAVRCSVCDQQFDISEGKCPNGCSDQSIKA